MKRALTLLAATVLLCAAAPPEPAFHHVKIAPAAIGQLLTLADSGPAGWIACLGGSIDRDTLFLNELAAADRNDRCPAPHFGSARGLDATLCASQSKLAARTAAINLQREFFESTEYVRIVMCSSRRFFVFSRSSRTHPSVPRATVVQT